MVVQSSEPVSIGHLLQREQMLAAISQRIRRSLDLDEVLNTSVEEVRQLLQTDRVLLYQFTPDNWSGTIAVESVSNETLTILGRNIQDECFQTDHAHLYQSGRVRAIDDIQTADIAPCHRDLLASLQVKANLIVPVLHHDNLWGLLIAHHCQAPRIWQTREIELLSQLSTVIAIAIQQASLYDRLQAELAERTAISAALQISRERLQALVFNAPIALIATDAKGIITLASGTILHRLGYRSGYRSEHDLGHDLKQSSADWVGCSAFDAYAHIPDFVEDLRRVLAGSSPDSLPDSLLDSSLMSVVEYEGYIFEIRYSPQVNEAGAAEGMICVATDVTEQRRAEEALRQSEILRQSEVKNRVLLKAIPDAIFRIHRDGTCLDFKPSKAEVSETPIIRLNQPISEVLPLPIAEQLMMHLNQSLATNQPQIFDYQLQQGKAIDYEARVVVNGTDEVLVIVRDISERKKVERLKNEFVSTVSHELRTPLTSIRGSLGLIRAGVAGDMSSEVQELIEIAHKNSERLIVLINDILDIEKIESGKMSFVLKPVELMPLVEQAIAANRSYAEQFNVSFTLVNTLPKVKVNVDSQRFIQVLTNLLSNAAKFSPPNETVTIGVTQHDRLIRISVHDRGEGIPEEFRDRIFQKFAQADSSDARQKGGTGLGLSIAKAIAERLEGQLGFETKINQGTTFYCDLPEWVSLGDRKVISSSEAQSAARTTLQTAQVLVCEDEPDIALVLKRMLERAGFRVDIAHTAEAAKQFLARQTYQVMTLDLALPGQDGISFLQEMRLQEQTRLLPVVIVSAKAQQGRTEFGEAGFAIVDWLDKPIDQDRLIDVCRRAVLPSRNSKLKVLHIEDNTDVVRVVKLVLKQDAEIHQAVNLQEARQKLEAHNFDLIILDMGLPDGCGLDLLPLFNHETGSLLPVVIFSARDVNAETAQRVTTALLKSRTSNQELLDTIRSIVSYVDYEEKPL